MFLASVLIPFTFGNNHNMCTRRLLLLNLQLLLHCHVTCKCTWQQGKNIPVQSTIALLLIKTTKHNYRHNKYTPEK